MGVLARPERPGALFGGADQRARAHLWRDCPEASGAGPCRDAVAALGRNKPVAVSPGDRGDGLRLRPRTLPRLRDPRRAVAGARVGRGGEAALCDGRHGGVRDADPAGDHLEQSGGAAPRRGDLAQAA